MLVEPWLPAAVLAVEVFFGYPQALYARISHPVVWIGKLIEALERHWNSPARSDGVRGLLGIVTTIIVAGTGADSLIGHREPRWRMYGWASARADDVANLIPARLAGVLIVTTGGSGWRVMWRDASRHASPNAGWTEAAMAGALRVQLGGSATYDGALHERPIFGTGRHPDTDDLRRALRIYLTSCALLWALALALAVGVT